MFFGQQTLKLAAMSFFGGDCDAAGGQLSYSPVQTKQLGVALSRQHKVATAKGTNGFCYRS